MRRIVLWLATTTTIVVLLFGYHTSTNKTVTTPPASTGAPAAGRPSSSPSSRPSRGSQSTSPSPSAGSRRPAATTKPYDGSVADTRWGPVQVRIGVKNGKITDVTLLQQPDGNPRDVEINDYAVPILVRETLTAQSANIDMVSGATVTSDGYLQSLQAALDEAGI